MTQMTFDGTGNDTRVDGFKVLQVIAEGDQFRWAHVGTGRRETETLAISSRAAVVTHKFIGKKMSTRYLFS